MPAKQEDLFAESPIGKPWSEASLARLRTQLHATLALVKSAEAMPWTDMLSIIREDNAFRYGTGKLPPAEGAALWAEFDVEMDRLYAIMNEGKEPDRDD
jgi:hypothetical protein